jgi:GalNAc-alpha-(1->4)-GalNAc-alpha-(1->3)-diNAcBac-PP-undecaprenol alpha-1,4-N-acetyl-D-galactosaminyltransferase
LLEAVALGLPSISTDCRSGPREISDGGAAVFLVPPDSSEALVSGLDHFLGDDALRHRLCIDGARSVRERYRLSAVLARWDSLFEYVLRTKGSTAKTEARS